MTSEHDPVIGDRPGQEGGGAGGQQQAGLVQHSLGVVELAEPVGEGQREQETEEHLDTEAGHPQLLEQLGHVPVDAFVLGLVSAVVGRLCSALVDHLMGIPVGNRG
jgi:hypothetical protein